MEKISKLQNRNEKIKEKIIKNKKNDNKIK